jgi:hypothetical protein
MAHLINTLQFEVNCPDEDLALSMRHNFAHTFQPQIESAIQKICDQYIHENEWLQLDKLEIDMGHLSGQAFNTEFEKIFLSKFEKQLRDKLSGISPQQRDTSLQKSKFELLTHFLLKGFLPWWADETTVDLNEICNEVFSNSGDIIRQFFLQENNNTSVWKRSANQLDKKSKQKIILLLPPLAFAKKISDEIFSELISFAGAEVHVQSGVALKKLRQQKEKIDDLVINNAPEFFSLEGNLSKIKKTLAAVIVRTYSDDPVALTSVILLLSKAINDTSSSQIVGKTTFGKNELGESYVNIGNDQDNDATLNEMFREVKQFSETKQNKEPDQDEAVKILVKNAGIILLAPFYKLFFSKLQLLAENEWVNRAAQEKGVFLLKYLSVGTKQYYEYQLVLEKLICGIPLNQPLETIPVLEQKEMDEAESLLQSAIEHWKKLGNTSVNGLRESFLKRDGIISPKENNWLMRVERKTLDVLVDSIPWGFSTVSLPWNRYIIFTEW